MSILAHTNNHQIKKNPQICMYIRNPSIKETGGCDLLLSLSSSDHYKITRLQCINR